MAAAKKASRKAAKKKASKRTPKSRTVAKKAAKAPKRRVAKKKAAVARKKTAVARKKPAAARKAVAPRATRPVVPAVAPTGAVAELDERIAIIRTNLRELVEQAASSSGASNEELLSQRIAEQEAKLALLTGQRDGLSRRKS